MTVASLVKVTGTIAYHNLTVVGVWRKLLISYHWDNLRTALEHDIDND